jgi:hypothetical protein
MKGYSIVIDDNSGTVPNGTVTTTAASYPFPKPQSNGFYIHISAVDNAGNNSAAAKYYVDDYISVTHPIIVSYAIDPNNPTPFSAPDIPITNNSDIPINVSIQGFSASGGGSIQLNDVSPDKYPDWSALTAALTKSDIALAIGVEETATGSSTWSAIALASPIYAYDITGKTLVGTLNPSGAKGNLALTAKCGLAWDDTYTEQHRLTLVFDCN